MNALAMDILTDSQTDVKRVERLVSESTDAGWLPQNSKANLAIWVIAEAVWTLNPGKMLDAARRIHRNFDHDPVLFAAVPEPLYDPENYGFDLSDETLFEFMQVSASELAVAIAEEMVREDDRCPDVFGNPVDGVNTVPMIVVHRDTTQEAGFWMIINAIRTRQKKLGVPLVEVHVHDGGGRLQLLEESVVRIRHMWE